MHLKKVMLFLFTLVLASSLNAQVLGSCGDTGQSVAPKVQAKEMHMPASPTNPMAVKPMPLPGQPAIDFQLPAVVGNNIKMVKLSDYAGKWRVLCFYPAAFTFV